MSTLAVVGAVAVLLATPSPAQAKWDSDVTITGKHVKAGDVVTATVTLADDGGIDPGSRMCLFQIVGDHAPPPYSAHGEGDGLPPGDKYVKLTNCQRPAPDRSEADQQYYDLGVTTYRLKVTSGGWLALAAFREDAGIPAYSHPVISNVVRVSGPGGTPPRAAATKATVVSMDPPREPTAPPTSPPASTPPPTDPSSQIGPPPVGTTVDFTDDPSSDEAAEEQAAREGRPKVRWLAAAATGGLLLGGLITGVTMTLWWRARAKKS